MSFKEINLICGNAEGWCVEHKLSLTSFNIVGALEKMGYLNDIPSPAGTCPSCEFGLRPDGKGGFVPCTICGREASAELDFEKNFIRWLVTLPPEHPARFRTGIARVAFYAGASVSIAK